MSRLLPKLLGSALKSSRRGYRVGIRTAAQGAAAVIRVADDGPGMSETGLQLAMEPFGQQGPAPGFARPSQPPLQSFRAGGSRWGAYLGKEPP